jgi:6-pyruvoyltetrahydropterin/6-carboxytetrahydropterin synthase
MVTDFKHLGWMKNFIDDTLDHKFIMDLQDPLFENEFPLICTEEMKIKMPEGFYIPNLTAIRGYCDELIKEGTAVNVAEAIFEKYEGAILVDFVPTSENLAGWLFTVAQEKMKGLDGIKVSAVEYWETPKSHCRVEA